MTHDQGSSEQGIGFAPRAFVGQDSLSGLVPVDPRDGLSDRPWLATPASRCQPRPIDLIPKAGGQFLQQLAANFPRRSILIRAPGWAIVCPRARSRPSGMFPTSGNAKVMSQGARWPECGLPYCGKPDCVRPLPAHTSTAGWVKSPGARTKHRGRSSPLGSIPGNDLTDFRTGVGTQPAITTPRINPQVMP